MVKNKFNFQCSISGDDIREHLSDLILVSEDELRDTSENVSKYSVILERLKFLYELRKSLVND